ncbi:MAG: 4-(cytidine 5'-diphospho)-2-C-methyl-D-erythritol kinase [Bacillota bacterium]
MPTSRPAPAAMAAVVRAPAKINLTLDVVGRRPDGFHEVATIYQALTLSDRVEVRLAWGPGDRGIIVRADDPATPDGPGNIAYRAAEVFLAASRGKIDRPSTALGAESPRVEVAIAKSIPAAAGLGGGSSDAAAVLRGLDNLLGQPLDDAVLNDLAAGLGSDVPFFLRGGTALGHGRGEVIEPLPDAPRFHAVLVKVGRKESTASVYAAHDRLAPRQRRDRTPLAVQAIHQRDHSGLAAAVGNDLAAAARRLTPEIGRVEAFLTDAGAEAVAVAGTGPTVYGLFRDGQEAALARDRAAAFFAWAAVAEFAAAAGER